MNKNFLYTRRVLPVLCISVFVCALLLYIFPLSYGIYAINGTKDTPLTRLIPVILGVLCASTIHAAAPAMEATAPRDILRWRFYTTTGVALLMHLILIICIIIFNALFSIGVSGRDIAIYTSAMLFWQGLCILSVSFTPHIAAWFPPIIVLIIFLMFSWRDITTPSPWNVLLTVNPLTLVISGLTFITGLAVLRFTEPMHY